MTKKSKKYYVVIKTEPYSFGDECYVCNESISIPIKIFESTSSVEAKKTATKSGYNPNNVYRVMDHRTMLYRGISGREIVDLAKQSLTEQDVLYIQNKLNF